MTKATTEIDSKAHMNHRLFDEAQAGDKVYKSMKLSARAEQAVAAWPVALSISRLSQPKSKQKPKQTSRMPGWRIKK